MSSPELKSLLGEAKFVIVNGDLILATSGGKIIKNSLITQYIELLRSDAPEIANEIQNGLKYSVIEKHLQELARELCKLKKSLPEERPVRFQKLKNTFENIKFVSESVKELKLYAKHLYNLAKPFIETNTGLSLPDWQ